MASFNDITMDDINSAADGSDETVTAPVAEPTPEPVAEPVEVQPEVEPEPVETPEPVEPATVHPWDADLVFVPDEHRGAVSKYLAEQWQPRMTQHEQDLKEWKDAFGGDPEVRDLGSKLINSFQTIGAEGTFLQMGVELGFIDPTELGDEWAEIYSKIGDDPTGAPDPADDSRLTPEEREILAWAKDQKEREFQETQRNELHTYYKELAKQAGIPDDQFNVEKFDVFFGGTMGDDKEAMEMYKAWAAGLAPPPPAPAVEEPPVPVLDDQSGGQAPPEVEDYGNDFQAAGKALMAELKAMEGR